MQHRVALLRIRSYESGSAARTRRRSGSLIVLVVAVPKGLQRPRPARAPRCLSRAKRVMSACARCGVTRHSVRRAVVAAAHRRLQHITRKDLCAALFSQRRTVPSPQWHRPPTRGAIEARAARCGTDCAVHVVCTPQAAPRRAFQPPSAHGADAHINDLAWRRDALGAWRRGAASAAGAVSQVHLQRRAPRASAAGNARRTCGAHDAARQRGAQVARQRGAVHAPPQSRVLHSVENVCAAARILSPAARAAEFDARVGACSRAAIRAARRDAAAGDLPCCRLQRIC